MQYQLMAVDMDGTLLNSDKHISPADADAVNRALSQGKRVVFCTGRCITELTAFFPLFPKMRYVLGESGALIYDLRQDIAVHRQSFDPELAEAVWRRMAHRDLIPQLLMRDTTVMRQWDIDHLERYHMSHYHQHFIQTGRIVEDVWTQGQENSWLNVDKICLFHTSPEERALSRAALQDLPMTLADAEETSLELSPLGVDKGKALGILCRHLGIPLEETIAVGDSYNDLSVLRTAGLSVAMGNAVPAVRSSCAAVVADNDHFGVAEAVERFLLR